MKKIYIIHGWEGSSERDWIPWTTNELKRLGYDAVAFDMPNSENPIIQEWVGYMKNNILLVDENTYFIGHSIGCQTILRFLETVDKKIGGAFFVSGWFDLQNLENRESEEIARPWIENLIDIDKVNNVLPWSFVLLGDNDTWVPHDITKQKFEKFLNSEVITIYNGGHITADDGYVSFPRLTELVHKKISGI